MLKCKFFFLLIFLFFFSLPVLAQVDTAWVRRYNGPGNSEDVASALTADDSGNVYVTGYSSGGFGTHEDYATIKYTADGDTLWARRYNGPIDDKDVANALAVDDSGNVYVTGYSSGSGTSYDYATIKYAPNGDTLWVRRYNGPGNGPDRATALAVDESGNVYVTGYADTDTGFPYIYGYSTIKYAPNGDTRWVRGYNDPGNGDDQASALAVDKSGNVYVTGSSGYFADYATIKYSPTGDTLWVRRYPGGGASALAVDDNGNVYVTGGDVTIKYSPNGDTLWVRSYSSGQFGGATALAVDGSGNVYVTGYSGSGTSSDFATIKYAPNGDTLWVRRYNGPGNNYDYAYALAVDGSGNVYVTGYSSGSGTSYDYATIKYAPNGDTLWVRRYNGPSNSYDQAYALDVDDSGNVYVTGFSDGGGFNLDYTTIKYVQFVCVDTAGDANGNGKITLPDIIFLVNRIFKGGPAPSPLCRGDANADGNLTLPDIIYLVNRIFKGGPAPLNSRECCL